MESTMSGKNLEASARRAYAGGMAQSPMPVQYARTNKPKSLLDKAKGVASFGLKAYGAATGNPAAGLAGQFLDGGVDGDLVGKAINVAMAPSGLDIDRSYVQRNWDSLDPGEGWGKPT
jgi:hypothetical protein